MTDVLSPLKFSLVTPLFMGITISGRRYANGRVSYDYGCVLIRNVRRMGSAGPRGGGEGVGRRWGADRV